MHPTIHWPSLRERLAYTFETSLAGGPAVFIVWLGVVSLAMILVLSALVGRPGSPPRGLEG